MDACSCPSLPANQEDCIVIITYMLSLVNHAHFPFDTSTSKHTLEELRTDLTTKLHAESQSVLSTLLRQLYSLPKPYCSTLSDLAIACRLDQDINNFLSIIRLKNRVMLFLESFIQNQAMNRQTPSSSSTASPSTDTETLLSETIEEDFKRIFKDDMAMVDLPILLPRAAQQQLHRNENIIQEATAAAAAASTIRMDHDHTTTIPVTVAVPHTDESKSADSSSMLRQEEEEEDLDDILASWTPHHLDFSDIVVLDVDLSHCQMYDCDSMTDHQEAAAAAASRRSDCGTSSSDMDITEHAPQECEPSQSAEVQAVADMISTDQVPSVALSLPDEPLASSPRYRFYSPPDLVTTLTWLRDRMLPWIDHEFEPSISVEELEKLEYDANSCISANVARLSLQDLHQRWRNTVVLLQNTQSEVQTWYAILAMEAAAGLLFPAHLICRIEFDSNLLAEEQRWAFLKPKAPCNVVQPKQDEMITQRSNKLKDESKRMTLTDKEETRKWINDTSPSSLVPQTSSNANEPPHSSSSASTLFSSRQRNHQSRRSPTHCQGYCGTNGQGRFLTNALRKNAKMIKGRMLCRQCRRKLYPHRN